MEDVIKQELLRFLPAKSLFRFRAVSKEWNDKIKSPLLAIQQSYHFTTLSGFFCQEQDMSISYTTRLSFLSLNHLPYGVPDPILSFLHEKITIISSSNGLLLLHEYKHDLLYICNPVTRKYKMLPRPTISSLNVAKIVLGFEPSALNMDANYQLINPVHVYGEPLVRFELYSSRAKTWRESHNVVSFDETINIRFTSTKFYFKGIAYWKINNTDVMAFDLNIEEGEILHLPEETSEKGSFGESKGEVCYLCILPRDPYIIGIYNLAQKEWHHYISVNVDQSLRDICIPWILPGFDGKTVMIHMGFSIYSCCLYDEKMFKMVADVKTESSCIQGCDYFAYINSLAPILIHEDEWESL